MGSDTRDHKQTDGLLEGERHRQFIRTMLGDLRALAHVQEQGLFERGVARIGCEQEMFLVDHGCQATPASLRMLEALEDRHFTTELGLFQLEMNADPQPFTGLGLSNMEAQLVELWERAWAAGRKLDVQPVLCGILPTLAKSDLKLEHMVPNPRYRALNAAMRAARGGLPFDFSINGLDELVVQHDSVMVEAACCSFQVHLQLTEPERFAHAYNVAQLLLGPVLAVCTNSPLLFGRRLWAETRISVFEQSCDIRVPTQQVRDLPGRVSFGTHWLTGNVLDLYKDNVARFRPLIGLPEQTDSMAEVEAGKVPQLKALRLHSGTIYRWNRPCYDISPSGKPHLRIEFRALPSGPSLADEVANAALWLGLMNELIAVLDDVPSRMDFDHARANLYAAARDGLSARLTWLDGEEVLAQPLLLEQLLPLAQAGLERAAIDSADIARYLSIVERRARSLRTGSRWMLKSLSSMDRRGQPAARISALTAAMVARQRSGRPVSEWERARLDERGAPKVGRQRVSQYMSTDIFTVRSDDPVELVAELMGWERIRHVPVEDDKGRLVGLVSYRSLLRHMTEAAKAPGPLATVPVSAIMKKELFTIGPDTLTTDAIGCMKRYRIGCLPVVQDEHIVGMVTEEDFMTIANTVLQLYEPPEEPGGPLASGEANGEATAVRPAATSSTVDPATPDATH